MIFEELTEKFINKHYFVCEIPFEIEKYSEIGFPTEEYIKIEAGTEWEMTDEDYIGGDVHLNGLTDNYWLEIDYDTFRKHFKAEEWLKRNKED